MILLLLFLILPSSSSQANDMEKMRQKFYSTNFLSSCSVCNFTNHQVLHITVPYLRRFITRPGFTRRPVDVGYVAKKSGKEVGFSPSTRRDTCSLSNLSYINPTWDFPELNPGLRDDRPATQQREQRHDIK